MTKYILYSEYHSEFQTFDTQDEVKEFLESGYGPLDIDSFKLFKGPELEISYSVNIKD